MAGKSGKWRLVNQKLMRKEMSKFQWSWLSLDDKMVTTESFARLLVRVNAELQGRLLTITFEGLQTVSSSGRHFRLLRIKKFPEEFNVLFDNLYIDMSKFRCV